MKKNNKKGFVVEILKLKIRKTLSCQSDKIEDFKDNE